MKIANFDIEAIAVTNKHGNIIALISDDDIIEHDDCKVTLIADDSDYKFKVFKFFYCFGNGVFKCVYFCYIRVRGKNIYVILFSQIMDLNIG